MTTMKKIYWIPGIVLLFVLSIVATGNYPIASVNGTWILYKTWHQAENSAKSFAMVQAVEHNLKPVNFSDTANAEVLKSVRGDTLTFLIEDRILMEEGRKTLPDFDVESQASVAAALQAGGADITMAAKLAYGLNLDDFETLVLLPQARRDIITKTLQDRGQDFDAWLSNIKKTARVKLFLIPFRWDGEFVK